MKKTAKIVISLLLLLSVVFSLASCDVLRRFRSLKNGPGTTYADTHEAIWVESYDEMVIILSKMKTAGTRTPQIPAFDCEEYGIDIKFQIIIQKSDVKNLEAGQHYYDVKLNNVDIKCYLFFEEITIEQIRARYSIMTDTRVSFRLYAVEKNINNDVVKNPKEYEDLTIHNDGTNGAKEVGRYHIYYNGKNQFYIQKSWAEFDLTEEQIEILKKTVTVIE